jgi:ribosomal protein L12E/L44/L45/RPP1/RPP2
MAKKTRKVLKQQSQQRAIQQAQANINTVNTAPAADEPVKQAAPQRAAKTESITNEQEFAFVKSDVRKSLTLAGIFTVAMIALSFVVR